MIITVLPQPILRARQIDKCRQKGEASMNAKQQYVLPELEIVRLKEENVITASDPGPGTKDPNELEEEVFGWGN